MPITIPLTQGQVATVSDEDAGLAMLKWQAKFDPTYANGGKFKAARNVGVKGRFTTFLMHRVIMESVLSRPLLRSELVDHVDLNPLNNCRDNLRLATNSQNCRNTGKKVTNLSGYKGVERRSQYRWLASITVNGVKYRLGSFDNPEEAHEAYKIAAIAFFGEFARFE